MYPGRLWKCTSLAPRGKASSHRSLPVGPFSLEGTSHGHLKALGAPSLLLSQLRLGGDAFASREGSWRMGSVEGMLLAMDIPDPFMVNAENPGPLGWIGPKKKWGAGHHPRAWLRLLSRSCQPKMLLCEHLCLSPRAAGSLWKLVLLEIHANSTPCQSELAPWASICHQPSFGVTVP